MNRQNSTIGSLVSMFSSIDVTPVSDFLAWGPGPGRCLPREVVRLQRATTHPRIDHPPQNMADRPIIAICCSGTVSRRASVAGADAHLAGIQKLARCVGCESAARANVYG
jgi:hypothetical protein